VFNEQNISIENFRPTKCWQIKTAHRQQTKRALYIENVKNHEITGRQSANKYKIQEIATISMNKNTRKIEVAHPIVDHNSNIIEEGVLLNFDKSEPKINFELSKATSCKCENDIDEYILLLEKMLNFAGELKLFDANNGSHLCINLRSTQTKTGYLHTRADIVYDIHPDKENFLVNFKKNSNYFIST
jgi:hypothetical protein